MGVGAGGCLMVVDRCGGDVGGSRCIWGRCRWVDVRLVEM